MLQTVVLRNISARVFNVGPSRVLWVYRQTSVSDGIWDPTVPICWVAAASHPRVPTDVPERLPQPEGLSGCAWTAESGSFVEVRCFHQQASRPAAPAHSACSIPGCSGGRRGSRRTAQRRQQVRPSRAPARHALHRRCPCARLLRARSVRS